MTRDRDHLDRRLVFGISLVEISRATGIPLHALQYVDQGSNCLDSDELLRLIAVLDLARTATYTARSIKVLG